MLSHLFQGLFATSIGSLMGHQDLHSIFDQVVLFSFSSLSFKVDLCMLDKPLSAVSFSPAVACLLSLTLSFPGEPVFNSVKFSLSRVSFTNHVFGAIWKMHHHIQGHLGFLLCYPPGVLQFCIPH